MGRVNTTQLGRIAEQSACNYLQKHGLKLLEKNYRSPVGEIDLIMLDQDIIVFVEVRYRSSRQITSALETIDHSKCMRIIKSGAHYLQKYNLSNTTRSRFDVILLQSGVNSHAVEWIKNAFEA